MEDQGGMEERRMNEEGDCKRSETGRTKYFLNLLISKMLFFTYQMVLFKGTLGTALLPYRNTRYSSTTIQEH